MKKFKVSLAKKEREPIKKTKILVIGIGGGGSSIISEIATKIKKANFLVVNTDRQALKIASKKARKLLIGQNLTFGLGTGMNPEIGEEAALNEKEKIKKILKDQDLCLIVSSLGGGVSSGASPVFAKIARSLGIISYGIFTLPFKFEGEKKVEIAKEALEKLKPNLNAISVLPNERIFQLIDKRTPLKVALSAINQNLIDSLGGLLEMIYQPGLINIDFADLKSILEKKGRLTYLNTIEADRKDNLQETIKKLIFNPLYPYTIKGARGILFNISGEKDLGLKEVEEISRNLSQSVNKEAKIIFGISTSQRYQKKIKITLLATGCTWSEIFPSKKTKPPVPTKEPIPAKKEKAKPSLIPRPRKKTIKRKKPSKVIAIKEEKKPAEKEKEALPAQIRKNALELKKEIEEAEREMLEKEEIWEPPAFLRKKTGQKNEGN